jgi:DNA-binding response OmpR family regulator
MPVEQLELPAGQEIAVHALIIEDESLIALAIEDALRECGFASFDYAISAEEAVAAAARRRPDLVAADVELRPGCGISAVQSICSELPIPVLFITGRPIEVRTMMPHYALIEKPFSADHILAAIKLALQSRDLSVTGRGPSIDGGG